MTGDADGASPAPQSTGVREAGSASGRCTGREP